MEMVELLIASVLGFLVLFLFMAYLLGTSDEYSEFDKKRYRQVTRDVLIVIFVMALLLVSLHVVLVYGVSWHYV
jgi:biotin transporter BioY